jgi:hypothetical protein
MNSDPVSITRHVWVTDETVPKLKGCNFCGGNLSVIANLSETESTLPLKDRGRERFQSTHIHISAINRLLAAAAAAPLSSQNPFEPQCHHISAIQNHRRRHRQSCPNFLMRRRCLNRRHQTLATGKSGALLFLRRKEESKESENGHEEDKDGGRSSQGDHEEGVEYVKVHPTQS